jgi:Flp pilus assembly protein TadG
VRYREKERGAAAVEFALVFPLVIMLLITVIEFSRLWNIQATLTDAAMVSARYAALHSEDVDVVDKAKEQAQAIPGFVDWSIATIDVTPDCAVVKAATSEVSVAPGSVTGWFASVIGTPIELSATGRMPCGS